MRGTLVASAYPLYVPVQSRMFHRNFWNWPARTRPEQVGQKKLFQSMVSEAVYNATQIQIGDRALVDYCPPSPSRDDRCVPPVWVSIIGDDGFWPVDWQSMPPGPMASFVTASAPIPVTVLPLPGPTWLLAFALLGVVAVHVGIVTFVWAKLPAEGSLKQFQRIPFVRVLAAPITCFSASRLHAHALLWGFAVLSVVAMWISGMLAMHAALAHGWPSSWTAAIAGVIVCGAAVMTPAILFHQRSKRFPADDLLPTRSAGSRRENGASGVRPKDEAPARGRGRMLTMALMFSFLATTLAFFLVFLGTTFLAPIHRLDGGDGLWLGLKLDRFTSGGMVSPIWIIVCLFAAIYAVIFAGLRRISLLGSGYTALAAESRTFRLLAGAPIESEKARTGGFQAARSMASHLPLVRLLDMPAHNLPWPYPVTMVGLLLIILPALSHPHTVEGRAFSAFLMLASAFILCSVFLLLAQAIEIWRRMRPGLTTLAHSRLEPALTSVAGVVRWNLSLVSPHLSDLEPLATLADRLYGRLVSLAAAAPRDRRWDDIRTSNDDAADETASYAALLKRFLHGSNLDGLIRPDDLSAVAGVTRPTQLASLRREMAQLEYAPLLQSHTWFRLWDTSDQLVGILETLHWHRYEPISAPAALAAARPLSVPAGFEPGVFDAPAMAVQEQERRKSSDRIERVRQLASWLSDAETLIALQCGLVLRDILSRVMSCLFTSMLCLTLLSAGHLFYLFQGRSALLTVDLVAVAFAASIAIWLLVSMERDTVLSRLRHTTPGRVDINWEFLKRIAIYGVLPLIAVLGSLFPEIQQPLLGWLDPLRKLVNF
jgi:hypothetical protein